MSSKKSPQVPPLNVNIRRSQFKKSTTQYEMHSSVVVSPKVYQFDANEKTTL